MNDKKTEYSIIDELYLENEELLREQKLTRLKRQHEIKNGEQRLLQEEEKKDPNRGIFHTVNAQVFNKEADRIREELFAKKEELASLEKKILELEGKKERLHEIRKVLCADTPKTEEIGDEAMERLRSRQLLLVQEQDRNRIAADLHDSTVQSMTALLHKVELIERYQELDRNRAAMELSGMKDSIREMIREMREIIFDLRPMSLENLGLWMAVKEFLDKVRERESVQLHFEVSREAQELKLQNDIEINLFRMIQEAVNNSVKHAQASLISVSAEYSAKVLMIVISDDGEGFHAAEASREDTFGMRILQERANILDASFKVQSGKSGTEITIQLPLDRTD